MSLNSCKLKEAQVLARKFVDFLNATGSPFHTVKQLSLYLTNHLPIKHLNELRCVTEQFFSENWKLENGQSYYVTNNNGTMMAFNIGKKFDPSKGGLILVCSHTDSPCLKLDFKCHVNNKGFNQLSVTTYGGGLWHTWMDRDLGLAGKVVVKSNGKLEEKLLHVQKPLILLPNLAIHLQNSTEREALKLNKDNHLKPLISTEVVHNLNSTQTEPLLKLVSSYHSLAIHLYYIVNIITVIAICFSELKCEVEDLVDFELCLMDSNPSCLSGVYEEFVSSGRLDNLGSCFGSISAFTDFVLNQGEDNDAVVVTVSYNYEEIGSSLSYGADSNVTFLWLEKLFGALGCSLMETRDRALVVSADMTHGVHPNYSEKHISTHSPAFHAGVVLKWNVNGRYATETHSSSLLRTAAASAGVPLQEFRVGNETPCGSTVGPILGSRLCVPVADVGFPQLAMHSCREMCSTVDLLNFKLLLQVLLFMV
ncbi:aspartyl aminopeptidase, putative [Theileria annulata]|uniref:aspartyl aminopeptidase n=1 Tax=Theileria annulata TaxID=5874 RepID=Q4UIZ5_THEAN|nr:aspartyl aminopeptidase, putative [Theileria annulata]CAI72944.1 aspartyl aminopeptidase, putative [Theileria annulata]|eukprot:XP_953622.1 aspartyl aminopeptidase, putative [Theileria annulata]